MTCTSYKIVILEEGRYNVAVWFQYFITTRTPTPLNPHPRSPLQFPPHVHCSPSFHVPPKKTKIYTKSYKMPIQNWFSQFGKMHILHNYALLCMYEFSASQ